MRKFECTYLIYAAVIGLAFVAMSTRGAAANTSCVNPNPQSGCAFTHIQNAVDAASPGDTINVAPGTYQEDVHITKPLSLIGAGAANTIIDASGKPNGVFVDGGVPLPPVPQNTLSDVTVSGFTVENANFEGILVANASYVTVWKNNLSGNDRGLSNGTCPGIPDFETMEGFDCGEAIHLTGVDHATVSGNDAEHNAGGILLSDDTGPTDHNLIIGNTTANNPYDCGITLASHQPYGVASPVAEAYGVFHNTIAENTSERNGLAPGADGAGIGIFTPSPGKKNYGNIVIKNRLTANGLPGVALHSHAPGQNLDDNLITENYIAGNGADSDVETNSADQVPTGIALLGVSPNSGTVIAGNTIKDEGIAIAVNLAGNTTATVDAHLNNLLGNGSSSTGIANLAAGSVNGRGNWWGCANGPGAAGCSAATGNVVTTPYLTSPAK